MPLYLEKRIGQCRLAVWQMTETVDDLIRLTNVSEKLKREVEGFQSEKRKKEWLTVRILLNDVLRVAHSDEIIYDDKGKPHLEKGKGYISFSHTQNFAAIIYHPEKSVGIDIETEHPSIEKIAHKFVNEKESLFINKEKQKEMFHVIWGVKEVLFKMDGKGEIDFRKHLHVKSFTLSNEGTVDAEIRKDNSRVRFAINYFYSEKFILVYGSH